MELPKPDPNRVLAEALLNAASFLGITKAEVGKAIDKHPSNIARTGIDPTRHSGQIALLIVRIYRSLFALMGGDQKNMRHFMYTQNNGTGGIPREQIQTIQGVVAVCEYLDAMRGNG